MQQRKVSEMNYKMNFEVNKPNLERILIESQQIYNSYKKSNHE